MNASRVHILLVEDDPDDVWIMRNLLSDRWDGPYELTHVELLAAALEVCRQRRFDVILLDLALPDSQGLETFFALGALADDVPIVVLTGFNDESAAVKAVQAGAQDYLVKGQVDDRLLMRSIRYAMERSRRQQAELAMHDASEEFRAAGEIQQRLYPESAPELPGFDIAGAVFPAKATAGDYFDYIPMTGGRLAVVVGDVSSHGMGPALLMSETRACLRALALSHDNVGDILTCANRVLSADTGSAHFVTLAMVLHFRRSQGKCDQGFEESSKISVVLVFRQSGEEFFVQHFAGNAPTAVGVRRTAGWVVPTTLSAVGQFGLAEVPTA